MHPVNSASDRLWRSTVLDACGCEEESSIEKRPHVDAHDGSDQRENRLETVIDQKDVSCSEHALT